MENGVDNLVLQKWLWSHSFQFSAEGMQPKPQLKANKLLILLTGQGPKSGLQVKAGSQKII